MLTRIYPATFPPGLHTQEVNVGTLYRLFVHGDEAMQSRNEIQSSAFAPTPGQRDADSLPAVLLLPDGQSGSAKDSSHLAMSDRAPAGRSLGQSQVAAGRGIIISQFVDTHKTRVGDGDKGEGRGDRLLCRRRFVCGAVRSIYQTLSYTNRHDSNALSHLPDICHTVLAPSLKLYEEVSVKQTLQIPQRFRVCQQYS